MDYHDWLYKEWHSWIKEACGLGHVIDRRNIDGIDVEGEDNSVEISLQLFIEHEVPQLLNTQKPVILIGV